MKKKLPLNKRWPGKYSLRSKIYTPEGSNIEIETVAETEVGESILRLTLASCTGNIKPEHIEACKSLNELFKKRVGS